MRSLVTSFGLRPKPSVLAYQEKSQVQSAIWIALLKHMANAVRRKHGTSLCLTATDHWGPQEAIK